MNPSIFREYDIRGIVERDFPLELVVQLGRAIGSAVRQAEGKRIAVGHDCRLSSPTLVAALHEGVRAAGVDVVDVGQVPTPVLYFAVQQLQLDGGVQLTGSHNPPEYNGFKILVGKSTIHGDAIQALRRRIESQDFFEGSGSLERYDISTPYIDWIANNIKLQSRPLRVVVDGGNGVGGPIAVELYKRLGVEVEELFIEPDGRFPNHHPDPTVPENLEALITEVRERHADFGISFDGDADRIGVVDEQGAIVWGDRLMILLSREVLREQPGAAIVGEVKCSQTLYDDITAHGGQAIMWKTGHSLIKAKMRECNAALAGEMSGHIFFAHRYFGFDDAIYTGARLLELMSRSKQSLSERLADVPVTHATPELRFDCPEQLKFQVPKALAERFAKLGQVISVDGVRLRFEDSAWVLVRASNTQPVLVLRVEAPSHERMVELEAWLRAQVAEALQALS
ncbi:MAG: phosphomannomutase/phosphoglucomutase [Myxococcota bacterium]|jgi:phosphomannomutase/phosphoglucomutase|nr:phosphomannomutase/phosphoglucomutase [Myxococcota bacterium]